MGDGTEQADRAVAALSFPLVYLLAEWDPGDSSCVHEGRLGIQ